VIRHICWFVGAFVRSSVCPLTWMNILKYLEYGLSYKLISNVPPIGNGICTSNDDVNCDR